MVFFFNACASGRKCGLTIARRRNETRVTPDPDCERSCGATILWNVGSRIVKVDLLLRREWIKFASGVCRRKSLAHERSGWGRAAYHADIPTVIPHTGYAHVVDYVIREVVTRATHLHRVSRGVRTVMRAANVQPPFVVRSSSKISQFF